MQTTSDTPSTPSNAPSSEPQRKSAAWWDAFWARPLTATGRALTCRRTAEEALRLLAPALDRASASAPLRLLDLGCGHGDLTPLFLAEPRLSVVALDVSAAALSQFQARRAGRFPGRLEMLRASVYELPFPDGAFDAVVSFGYASAASYDGAEREVARVLRPGGLAIIDFASPSLYHWLGAPGPTLRWYRRFRAASDGTYHFGRFGLPGHFEPAGLHLEAIHYLNAYPPLERLARHPRCATLDRWLARLAGPVLGRVLLACLRRT
jgi:SAM-dependent methyltransferase